MESDIQKPNQSQNVALSQTQSQNQKPQEQKPQEKKPLSENAKLVQELKKLLKQIESLEKREKNARVAFDKSKKELDEIGAEKVKYAELLKKFDVLAVWLSSFPLWAQFSVWGLSPTEVVRTTAIRGTSPHYCVLLDKYD